MNACLLLKALFKRPARANGAGLHSSYEADGIDTAHARRYAQALGFGHDGIPVTFYYLLAQRAHLATMLDRPFPFRAPGIIHVENTLQEHGRADGRLPVRLDTQVNILPPGQNGAVHCVFDTSALQDGKLLFTCSSKYLAVRGTRSKAGKQHHDTPAAPAVASWALEPSSGRAYAAVSGDWNPIHLWPLTARLMGMRSPIIHGMHTVAKACAALENLCGRKISLISARFKSPIPLPGEARLAADQDAGTYVVSCDDRPAVEGTFAILAAHLDG